MLRLLTLLLLGYLPDSLAQQQCSLCFGGGEPNLNNTIGGNPGDTGCSAFANDVEIDADGCRDLQVLGYRWCDCPDYPEEFFCSMCNDGFFAIPNRFKQIPGLDKTCEDRLFVPKTSVDSCDDAMKPGFVCGCPEAEEPHCSICGAGTAEDAKIAYPDALLTINKVGSFTCQELVNQALLGSLTMEQCGLVQAEASETCGCAVLDGLPEETDEVNESIAETPAEVDEEPADSGAKRQEYAIWFLAGAMVWWL